MCEDKELLAQVARQDKQAFTVLYKRYQPQVMRYCGRLLNHDVETAADIADEVFCDIWQKSTQFRGDASAKSWIFSITHNKSVSYLRKHREIPVENEEQITELASTMASQEQQLTSEQQTELLEQALDQLSLEHKEALQLFYYHDMSVKEMAQSLAIKEATVLTRLHYAKKNMKPILDALGLPSAHFFDSG